MWRQRLTDLHHNWRPLIAGMVDAYLRWKYSCGSNIVHTQPPPSPTTGVTETNSLPPAWSSGGGLDNVIHPNVTPTPAASACTNPPSPHPPDNPSGSARSFDPLPDINIEIAAIDIYSLSTSIKIRVSSVGTDTTASALTELGFIGNVPFKPSVAVSIKTLELYHLLRRRKPSFRVEAFVKVISDLYLVRPTPTIILCHSQPNNRFRTAPSIAVCLLMHLMFI